MKALSRMDIALCNRFARTVWWGVVMDIQWGENQTANYFHGWKCQFQQSVDQFLQWATLRSVKIRFMGCYMCCLDKIIKKDQWPTSISRLEVINSCGISMSEAGRLYRFGNSQLQQQLCGIEHSETYALNRDALQAILTTISSYADIQKPYVKGLGLTFPLHCYILRVLLRCYI